MADFFFFFKAATKCGCCLRLSLPFSHFASYKAFLNLRMSCGFVLSVVFPWDTGTWTTLYFLLPLEANVQCQVLIPFMTPPSHASTWWSGYRGLVLLTDGSIPITVIMTNFLEKLVVLEIQDHGRHGSTLMKSSWQRAPWSREWALEGEITWSDRKPEYLSIWSKGLFFLFLFIHFFLLLLSLSLFLLLHHNPFLWELAQVLGKLHLSHPESSNLMP